MDGTSGHARPQLLVALVGAIVTALALAVAASGDPAAVQNAHFSPAGTVALPGLGLSLAWSPAGDALATGGHFRDKVTKQRYDTRTVDVRGMRLVKGFECHYWWTIAHAWTRNPYLGEVIADGGGDHAIKIWNATSAGSTSCNPGQFRAADGGVRSLYNINGWVTSMAFSPDGKYLAATSRDRSVRVWQIMPGIDQFKVVRLWYDKTGGAMFSVRWSPDGKRLAIGDRRGRVTEFRFDPAVDRWDEGTITAFARLGWAGQPAWFAQHAAMLEPTPLWQDSGHKQIWNVRYSPDGRRVASVGNDGVLSVIESVTGRVVYRVSAPSHAAFDGLDWSPDGAVIAVGAADKIVYVFNAADGSLYDRLVGHNNVVTAVAFSPNGRVLASTAGGPRISAALNQVVQGPDNAVHLWNRN